MLNKLKEHKIPLNFIIKECIDFCIKNNNWLDFSYYLKKLNIKKDSEIKNIESLINFHIANIFYIKREENEAKKYIVDAYENNKSFPPIIELYCKLKIPKSKRNLIKILKYYWKEFPHPNIKKCLEYGLDSKDIGLNILILGDILKMKKHSYIKYLIFGQLKCEAKIWGEAKKDILKSIQLKPSTLAYECLAEIENRYSHENNEASKWLKLSKEIEDDLRWKCKYCFHTQLTWSIYCRNCKSFNSLYWKQDKKLQTNLEKKEFNKLSIVK